MRLMSFSITTRQARDRTKSVTRRNGWLTARAGDVIQQVEKAMGLKKGEKIVRIHKIRVIGVRREWLRRMVDEPAYGRCEVILEGFPNFTPQEFVDLYCQANKCTPDSLVTRISFEYLD